MTWRTYCQTLQTLNPFRHLQIGMFLKFLKSIKIDYTQFKSIFEQVSNELYNTDHSR